MKHYVMTNPEQSAIVNLTAPSGSSGSPIVPQNLNIAELFYRTDSLHLEVYNGTGWTELALTGDPLTVDSFPLLAPVGSVAAPSYSFAGDTDTGIYQAAAGRLDFSVNNGTRFSLQSGSAQITVQLQGGSGSIGQPTFSFSGDPNTGMYRAATDSLGFVTNSLERLRIDANGLLSVFSVGSPGYHSLVVLDDDVPNKKYVDDAVGLYVLKAGDTMTGNLILNPAQLSIRSTNNQLLIYDTDGSDPNDFYIFSANSENFGIDRWDASQATQTQYMSIVPSQPKVTFFGDVQINGTGSPVSEPQFQASRGLQTLPGYSFWADGDTGMFSGGPDTLNFTTGGSAAMYIDSAGTATFNHQARVIATGGSFIVAQAIDGAHDAAFQGHIAKASTGENRGFFGAIPSDTNSYIAAYTWDNTGSPGNAAWNRVFGASVTALELQLTATDITYDGESLMRNLLEDTSPQLGGNLDPNGFNITGDLILTGTGSPLDAQIFLADGSTTAPSYTFNNDVDTGMYLAGANSLGLVVGGLEALLISSTGLLSVPGGSPGYETLVVADDNIPNKKYVDDDVIAARVAAPRKNLLINGGHTIWQDKTSITGIAGSTMMADMWIFGKSSTATLNMTQQAMTSGMIDTAYYQQLQVTVADASIAAGDFCLMTINLEGRDLAPVLPGIAGAKTVTLSFWHAHTKTGISCVSFRNDANNRSYVVEYTQSVANTWEREEITLDWDTTGTWEIDEAKGVGISFALAAGTSFHGTADTWNAANDIATSNQVNHLDSATTRFFRIAAVKLEIGEYATAFESPSFGEEQLKCQRYWNKSYSYGTTVGTATLEGSSRFFMAVMPNTSAYTASISEAFAVHMRAVPTLTFWSTDTGASGQIYDQVNDADITAVEPGTQSRKSFQVYGTMGTTAVSINYTVQWRADAKL